MDALTRERYGPLTEADLWRELHPFTPMPKALRDADRAARRRELRLDLEVMRGGKAA